MCIRDSFRSTLASRTIASRVGTSCALASLQFIMRSLRESRPCVELARRELAALAPSSSTGGGGAMGRRYVRTFEGALGATFCDSVSHEDTRSMFVPEGSGICARRPRRDVVLTREPLTRERAPLPTEDDACLSCGTRACVRTAPSGMSAASRSASRRPSIESVCVQVSICTWL